MTEVVQRLLKKVQSTDASFRKMGWTSPKRSSHDCVVDFLAYLRSVLAKHCRRSYDDAYLADVVFEKPRFFESDAESMAYCRGHLTVALRQLEKLFSEMKGEHVRLTSHALQRYRAVLVDYLFDLKPIVEYLESKKDPSYLFFNGGKNYSITTWQLFRACRQLQVQGVHPAVLEHKPAQIASVCILRQAMELKFERLVGVAFYDRAGQTPRLRHGFHYDFIKNNIDLYDFKVVRFELLRQIYDWTNVIVHRAFQPLAWQVSYATDLCSGLFASGEYERGWSIYGGVHILNKDEMQQRFARHFAALYDHGNWSVFLGQTEAHNVELPDSENL